MARSVGINRAPEFPESGKSRSGMVFVPGGTFRTGSDRHYPEAAPAHWVTVGGFWIDRTPVTDREVFRFVGATGDVPIAEQRPDPRGYPSAGRQRLRAFCLAVIALFAASAPAFADCRDDIEEVRQEINDDRDDYTAEAKLRARKNLTQAELSIARPVECRKNVMQARIALREGRR